MIITVAWIVDAVIGDPEFIPHPVRAIGKSVNIFESILRGYFKNQKIAGVFLGLFVPCASLFLTLIIVRLASYVSCFFGAIVSALIIYTCLSTRSLANEAMNILKKLREGDMGGSRESLSRIVGRDTAGLNISQIVQATIESVSENTVDGIISPLFYAFLGSAPLAIAYKAINTLDSMIGYKNEKYIEFGWFSARLDDAANFIPSRLCLVLVPLATLFYCPSKAVKVFKTGMRDGRKSPSPNSGFPEACFAAALGIQLGGECSYNGISHRKPFLGDMERENETEDIAKAVRLMWITSFIALILFSCIAVIINLLAG
jgi:adenosylcobinamide-phosphate synthase